MRSRHLFLAALTVAVLLMVAGCTKPVPASVPATVPPLPPETPVPTATTLPPAPETTTAAPGTTVKATATPAEACPRSMCPEGVNCYCCGNTTCPGNWGCCHTETGDICFDPERYRCTDTSGSSWYFQSCSGPDTTCPTGLRCCYGRCVDVLWDQSNCGICGRVCTQGSWCNRGKCQSYL